MKIEDFGEKIVGARKDLWMDLDHLDLYDEEDLHNYVRRDSIWPLPDAKAQIANGLDPLIAFWQRTVRRTIEPKPRYYVGVDPVEICKGYIQVVTTIRDQAMRVKDETDVKAFFRDAGNYFGLEPVYHYAVHKSMLYECGSLRFLQRKMIRQNFPEGNRKSVNRKASFVPPQLTQIVRTGPDYRHGRSTTSRTWQEFQFRGVQFGNWMSQADRQYSMDYCYDALKDLAYALDIDAKDIAFRGRLGMAFGARGRGRAAAHYDPAQVVINLTKMSGAGSTSHEWFHALDHYIAVSYCVPDSAFASKSNYSHLLPSAFQKLCKAVRIDENGRKTQFLSDSEMFNRLYNKDSYGYWSSTIEMLARAFACYVKDKLSWQSDYLCAHADCYTALVDGKVVHAMPVGEERKRFNQIFDELVEELKSDEILSSPAPEAEPTIELKPAAKRVEKIYVEQEASGQYNFGF